MEAPDLVLPTRVAHAGWDEHAYLGRKVFSEIVGNLGLTRLLALTLGAELSTEQASLMERIAEVSTAADPRVPPLLLARIVASEGRALSGICAGLLSCDEGRLGPWVTARASVVLKAMADAIDEISDETVTRWLEARKISGEPLDGFGAPFREVDERAEALLQTIDEAGHTGRHWTLARHAHAVAPSCLGLPANIALMAAAVLLDLGLDGERLAMASTLTLLHTFIANALEGADQKAEVLRCLPEEFIEYRGVPPRESPRARAARLEGE
jgi:hypothetical protein